MMDIDAKFIDKILEKWIHVHVKKNIKHNMIDFYPKMHGWLNIYKLINVIKDINRLKDKICIIISKDGVKAFGIIQNASMIKVLETIELEGMYLKRYIRKNYSQCYHKLRIAPKLLKNLADHYSQCFSILCSKHKLE